MITSLTRSEIEKAIKERRGQIDSLRLEIEDLIYQDYLLSDDQQWFTEEVEVHVVSKRPKKVKPILVGRINWREGFKDEGTGEVIYINRSQAVRVDGVWIK